MNAIKQINLDTGQMDTPKVEDWLAVNAILTSLALRICSFEKTDKTISRNTEDNLGATPGSLRTIKKFFPHGADRELNACKRAYGRIRVEHRDRTHPWTHAIRLLFLHALKGVQGENAMEFIASIGRLKAEAEAALSKLQAVYEERVAEAQLLLGGAASHDYPPVDTLRNLFHANVTTETISPSNTFNGLSIPGDIANQLAGKAAKRMETRIVSVMEDTVKVAFEELSGIAKTFDAKVNDPTNRSKGRVFTSVPDRLQRITVALKQANFTDDPVLQDIAAQLEREFVTASLDELRNDDGLAVRLAASSRDMVQKLSGYVEEEVVQEVMGPPKELFDAAQMIQQQQAEEAAQAAVDTQVAQEVEYEIDDDLMA